MTHTQKRIYLIKSLMEEQPHYADLNIPVSEQEQKNCCVHFSISVCRWG